MTAAVLGVGQVSAIGAGVPALRAALEGERPSATWLERWAGDEGARVPILRADGAAVRGRIAPATARRLDDFGVGALGAALLAVEDANLDDGELGRPGRTAIVVATGYGALGSTFGFLHDVVAKGDSLASPLHFSRSVHNAPAFVISSTLGIRGPTTTLTGFSLAWPRALGSAIDALDRRQVDLALLCSADEQHPVVVDALGALGVPVTDGADARSPIDRGYLAGETYTALVLGRAEERPSRWGRLEHPHFFVDAAAAPSAAAEPSDEPWFIATQALGDDTAKARALLRSARAVAAYGLLWGGNPTSDAMTVLAALVSLRDDRCYPSPGAPASPPTDALPWLASAEQTGLAAIRCVSIDGDGRGALVRVTR